MCTADQGKEPHASTSGVQASLLMSENSFPTIHNTRAALGHAVRHPPVSLIFSPSSQPILYFYFHFSVFSLYFLSHSYPYFFCYLYTGWQAGSRWAGHGTAGAHLTSKLHIFFKVKYHINCNNYIFLNYFTSIKMCYHFRYMPF